MSENRFVPHNDTDIEAREKRERELFEQIVNNGSFVVNTVWKAGGEKAKSDERLLIEQGSATAGTLLPRMGNREFYQKKGVTEIVMIKEATKEVYRNVRVGIFKQRNESRYAGVEHMPMSDFMSGGEGKASYIYYYTMDNTNRRYTEPWIGGRAGQKLSLKLILPDDLARKVWDAIKLNPKFISLKASN